jgi:ureidoacrylate peracid hydrolase
MQLRPMIALALIDLQNAFCHSDGSLATRGLRVLNVERVVEKAKVLIRFFQFHGWPIFCTKMEFSADYRDAGLLVSMKYPIIRQEGVYAAGSWDAALVDGVACELPLDAFVLSKTRYDAFVCTDIETRARILRIEHFVVGGVLTNVCVESFVRSAFDRDFIVTTLKDGTATYSPDAHLHTLATIERHFGHVTETSTLLKELARSVARSR